MAIELGSLLPHEPIAQGYARAIGYSDLQSLRSGMVAGEVGERHRAAVTEILAGQSTTILIARNRDELEGRTGDAEGSEWMVLGAVLVKALWKGRAD